MDYSHRCGLKAMPEKWSPQPCPNPDCDGTIKPERFVLDREFTSNPVRDIIEKARESESTPHEDAKRELGITSNSGDYDPHEPVEVVLSRDEANTLLNIADDVRQAMDKGDS